MVSLEAHPPGHASYKFKNSSPGVDNKEGINVELTHLTGRRITNKSVNSTGEHFSDITGTPVLSYVGYITTKLQQQHLTASKQF